MKKSILFSLILFFISLFILPANSFATSNEFSDLSIDIKIDDNGTAYVSEKWEIEVYSGTELYKSYYNLESSEIKNLTVSENNQNFTTLSDWDTSLSLNDKKQKCGINNVTDGVEICFGIGDYGKHIYNISYEITNFVYEENGNALTYFTLVPSNMDPVPQNVNIIVRANTEFSDSNVIVSGEGAKSTTNIDDGIITLKTTSLTSSEYVALKLEYTDLFNLSGSSTQTQLSTKTQANNSEVNTVVNEDSNNEENKNNSILYKVLVLILVTFVFFAIAYFINFIKNKKKDNI